MNERQDCIDEVKRLRRFSKEHRKTFYDLELYDDLALEEIKASSLGISEEELC